MGWHAVTMVMLSVILAVRRAGWQRLVFVALAGWGGVGLMLCARRKMVSVLVIFLAIFLVLLLRHRRGRGVLAVALVVGGAATVWSVIYQKAGTDQEVETFYRTTLSESGDRFMKHAFEATRITVKQAGLFGYGLGMAVQGAHHIKVERPNIWQEGGLPKLLAEIGVPGVVAFLVLLLSMVSAGIGVLKNVADFPHAVVYFGLAALLGSNLVSAIISAQVFGDPFIGTLLPFWAGVFLSGRRLAQEGDEDESTTEDEHG